MVNKWLTKSIIGSALAGIIIASGPVLAQDRGHRGDRDRDRAGQSQQHNGDHGRAERSHRGDRGHVSHNRGRGHNRHALGRHHGHGHMRHAGAHRHNNHAYHRHDRRGLLLQDLKTTSAPRTKAAGFSQYCAHSRSRRSLCGPR